MYQFVASTPPSDNGGFSSPRRTSLHHPLPQQPTPLEARPGNDHPAFNLPRDAAHHHLQRINAHQPDEENHKRETSTRYSPSKRPYPNINFRPSCNGGPSDPRLTGPPPPMYPCPPALIPLKDQSPSGSSSGSNRSSTVSNNSSGYSGSCGQLPLHLKHHHRLSGQSIESGISTLSSQYAHSPVTSSSHSSLDKGDSGSNILSCAAAGGASDFYQQGLKEAEALYTWLQEINQTDCYQLFLQSGYDKPTISRMTPEDLTAIGITIPTIRKKLTAEISRLQIPDGIPNYWPSSLKEWLNLLHLQRYHDNLTKEGYHVLEDVLQITWEDLEEIGIKKLGHQKKIILAIDKLKKINMSKNLPPGSGDLFDFNRRSMGVKNRKRSPVPCHKLIADQITAKSKPRDLHSRKSPEIIHLNQTEVPAPEIVAIQVNRSWSLTQQEPDKPLKYESFHGSPSRDFKSLLRETSPSCEVFQSVQSAQGRFYEPPPSPAPDSSLSSPVKMRPPQVAPKPSNRTRRASGGATIGMSLEAEILPSTGLKRQNSCQGSILTQFSPVGEAYHPADIFQHVSICEGIVASESSMWKKAAPPAPPKRTNSIKSDLNTISSSDAYQKFPGGIAGYSSTDSESFPDPNAKLPPLARGLSRNWPTQNKDVHPSHNATSLSKLNTSDRSSSDCNTLPFANENVGTIRQKSSTTSIGDSNSMNLHFSPSSIIKSPSSKDPSKRPPVKPKPKLSSGSVNSSPAKGNADIDSEMNCDSVFDDIDSMFQGLAKELDEMLIG